MRLALRRRGGLEPRRPAAAAAVLMVRSAMPWPWLPYPHNKTGKQHRDWRPCLSVESMGPDNSSITLSTLLIVGGNPWLEEGPSAMQWSH